MIDVHILIHPSTPFSWTRLARSSVRLAASRSPFPVAVHELDAVEGHIGEGRAKGYAMGEYPYVTCVDDDDYVLPDAFVAMANHLGQASTIFTPEARLQNDCLVIGPTRHHLVAYHRDCLIDHAKWPSCGDVAQMNHYGETPVDLPVIGYVHRVYLESKARNLRTPEELEAARVA